MWENITGYIPPVILQCLAAKSHCLLSTWLESSSEVWSSTIWRTEDYWGPSEAFFSFWQYQHSASPLQPGTVLRWTRFLLCFRYCDGCQDLQGLTGEEWKNLWMCVGRKQSKKKKNSRSFFYLTGHPQIPVGDFLTELPTKLDVEKKRAKEKM